MLNYQDFLNFNHYRSILCLRGTLPSADFFPCHLPIIAADGAANILMDMGITPSLVIGDLDSIALDLRQQFPTVLRPDQDYCDFEKALVYLEEKKLLPTLIVGVNGGYLDHVLNNVNIMLRGEYVFYAPPIIGFTLTAPVNKELILPLNTKISFIGVPHAEISSMGLQWELNNYVMQFPGKNSCFNRTVHNSVSIQITKGTVLVLIYAE